MSGASDQEKNDLIGRTIADRFHVEGILGSGAMGRVYAATDVHLGRRVAIKVLHSVLCSDARFLMRFRREARTIAQLSSNPHVVTIYDIGATDTSQPYLVMEYLTGSCLSGILDSGVSPSRTWVLEVSLHILSALIDAHAQNVVHRDLKPANVFVMSTKFLPLHAKVLDFGLSRNPELPMSLESATHPGTLLGTPKYMAPEVLGGVVTPALDLYSLGIILYELATGAYPYRVESVNDCLKAHLIDQPAPFPEVEVPFPAPFEDCVLRMLAKNSSERPKATECYRVLSRISTEIDITSSRKIRENDTSRLQRAGESNSPVRLQSDDTLPETQ